MVVKEPWDCPQWDNTKDNDEVDNVEHIFIHYEKLYFQKIVDLVIVKCEFNQFGDATVIAADQSFGKFKGLFRISKYPRH